MASTDIVLERAGTLIRERIVDDEATRLLSGFRPTFNDRLGQAYPTIPRSNDNKDAVILPGTRPFSYRQNRGIGADFVLILGDKPLGPARHPRA